VPARSGEDQCATALIPFDPADAAPFHLRDRLNVGPQGPAKGSRHPATPVPLAAPRGTGAACRRVPGRTWPYLARVTASRMAAAAGAIVYSSRWVWVTCGGIAVAA